MNMIINVFRMGAKSFAWYWGILFFLMILFLYMIFFRTQKQFRIKTALFLFGFWFAGVTHLSAMVSQYRLALFSFAASFGLLLLSGSSFFTFLFESRSRTNRLAVKWTAIIAVFTASALLRFHGIDDFPPGINDYTARAALDAVKYGNPLNIPAHYWNLKPGTLAHAQFSPVYLSGIMAAFKLFGPAKAAVKIAGAAWSMIGLVVAYLFFRKGMRFETALAAVFLLGASLWHTGVSRTGDFIAPTWTFSVIILALIYESIRKKEMALYALTATAVSLSVYFYASIRIMAPFAFFIFFINIIIRPERIKYQISGLLIFTVITGCVFYLQTKSNADPFNTFFYQRKYSPPDVAFWHRSETGYIIIKQFNLSAAWKNFMRNLDWFMEHLLKRTILFPLVAVCFPAGLVALIFSLRNQFARLIFFWGIVSLIPALITKPVSRRMFLFIHILFLAASLGFFALMKLIEKLAFTRRQHAALTAAAVLILSTAIPYAYGNLYRNQTKLLIGSPHVAPKLNEKTVTLLAELLDQRWGYFANVHHDKFLLKFLLYEKGIPFSKNKNYEFVTTTETMSMIKNNEMKIPSFIVLFPESRPGPGAGGKKKKNYDSYLALKKDILNLPQENAEVRAVKEKKKHFILVKIDKQGP